MSLSLVKAAYLIPAVVSGLWMVKHEPVMAKDQVRTVSALSSTKDATGGAAVVPSLDRTLDGSSEKASRSIITRRLRVDRILGTLDQISEVSLQMAPEYQGRIEPVITDLAEQAAELSSETSVRLSGTDAQLDRIESTLDRLIGSLARVVEPEVSL